MASVGIVTFHAVYNFGASLQAWSLAHAIRSMGHDVKVIDYRPPAHEQKFKRRGWRSWVPSPGRLRYGHFLRTRIPMTATCRSPEEVGNLVRKDGFDTLVCGSDQIWRVDRFLGYDRAYFLDLPEAGDVRRISYAASAGDLESYGEHADQVREAIRGLDAVAVRDQNTLRLVEELGVDRPVTRVVDPTLLVDFEPLIGRPTVDEKKMVVVGKTDAKSAQAARAFADRHGLRILAVGTRCSTADARKGYVDPAGWAREIATARVVVSSLFHGVLLSLATRRPFVAVGAAGRTVKIKDVLGHLGVPERFIEFTSDEAKAIPEQLVDLAYADIEPTITRSVGVSRDYLTEQISG